MSDKLGPFDYFSSNNQLTVLSYLAKFSDREFHEREIARRTGISYGSANKVLNELLGDGMVVRRQAGRMLFYSFNSRDPLAKTYKIFVSVSLIRPLILKLREKASEIVLFGSCARGEDTSASDIDLFIISGDKPKCLEVIRSFAFGKGFEGIVIEPAIRSPLEMIKSEKTEKEFLSLVREGIILWDRLKNEAGIQGLPEAEEDLRLPRRKATHL